MAPAHPNGKTRYQMLAAGCLLVAIMSWAGCGRRAKMVEIDKSYDGREVALNIGDTAELSLGENPTTGYRWTFTSKPEPACKVVNDSFDPGGSAPGAGGTHRWKLEAVSSGTGAVELQYLRPWEKDAAAGQTFKLNIRVR